MRVTHVTNYFPPYSYGGTEFYVKDLLREQARAHRVSVVFRRRQSSDRERLSREENGFTVHELNFPKGDPRAFEAKGKALFSEVLEADKPDVAHFHSFMELPYGLLDAAQEAGIPCVFTVHDFSLLCPSVSLVKPDKAVCSGHVSGLECFDCHSGHLGLKAMDKAKRLPLMGTYLNYQKKGVELLGKFDAVLCPTDFAARKLAEFGVSKESLVTVPFGRTLNPRVRFKSVGDVLRFGFIGDLVPFKGIELLIAAFRSLRRPDAELNIWGQGSKEYEDRLISLAGDAPVNFLGTFERTYIDRVFEQLDVLVLPTRNQETASLILLEAAACNVPVLASNAGGLPELVKKYNAGLVFESGDARSLAERMEAVAEDSHFVEQLSRQMAPVQSLEAHARALEEIYKGLAGK